MLDAWALIPVSRPECIENVRKNLARQRTPIKSCVVLNGRAESLRPEGFDLVLHSKNHASHARNAALVELRKRDAYVICFDDDDHYGSEYVTEHLQHARSGRIVGKRVHWVHWVGDCLRLYNVQHADQLATVLIGASIAGFAVEMPDFRILEVGEDDDLCRRFSGEKYASSVDNLVYVRREDPMTHTYRCTRKHFEQHIQCHRELPESALEALLSKGL